MRMLGDFTHGHSTETGCCEPGRESRYSQNSRKSHRNLHQREVRRYKKKEKSSWVKEWL